MTDLKQSVGELIPPSGDLWEHRARATPLLTRIGPSRGWQWINVRELWQYRELIYFLAWRDVKVRYKQTALGAAWAILQPLLMMTIFTIFFADGGGAVGRLALPVIRLRGVASLDVLQYGHHKRRQ